MVEGKSVTQKLRALSSGESDTAILPVSRSMTHKYGAGTCGHIEIKYLWLQYSSDDRKFSTKDVPTKSNVAYIGTKGLTHDRIWKLVNLMGMHLAAHGDVDS